MQLAAFGMVRVGWIVEGRRGSSGGEDAIMGSERVGNGLCICSGAPGGERSSDLRRGHGVGWLCGLCGLCGLCLCLCLLSVASG